MASFMAKQLLGNKLDSVKGAVGGDKDGEENKEGEGDEGPDQEHLDALREQEERRQEKHRRMEEEREEMRKGIRDKYGLKKKEEMMEENNMAMGMAPDMDGRLGRKRKTPEELAAEAELAEEEEDSILSFLPPNVRDMANKVTETPSKMLGEAQEKCVVQ